MRLQKGDAESNRPATFPCSLSRGVQPIAETSPLSVSGAASTAAYTFLIFDASLPSRAITAAANTSPFS
jgi:hypothetical protein